VSVGPRPIPGCRAVALVLLAALLVALAGCARKDDTDRLTFQAFGTLVDITLFPPAPMTWSGSKRN
jgi:hypothetical protein